MKLGHQWFPAMILLIEFHTFHGLIETPIAGHTREENNDYQTIEAK